MSTYAVCRQHADKVRFRGVMDLSVCICTLDNRDFLERCLKSLISALQGLDSEVIVVDNGSSDGTGELLASQFPQVKVISNAVNRGVAPARNQALAAGTGRFLLLLDADTELVDFDMRGLLAYMDLHPDVGLLGVRQTTFDDAPYISARTFPRPRDILLRRLSFLRSVRGSAAYQSHHVTSRGGEPIDVDYVIGAFQLIPRIMWERVGPLDEGMFYGFEDADYCARLKKAGARVVYHRAFSIRHYVQGFTRRRLLSSRGLRLLGFHVRSYWRFYRRHRDLLR